MPGIQLSFTEDNVKKNPFDYPKLKLAKGETALLTYVENPYSEYVHQVQKPLVDDKGNIIMRVADKKDGTQYETPKLTWVSSPICLGDREVLDEDGLDPENCIICARAAAGEKGFYPKRRFAMHVIKTNTRPGTFDPTDPPSRQLLIWSFTENRFNEIYSLAKQWGLEKHDLQLGPCEDADYQKAKLQIAPGTSLPDADEKAKIFAEKNRAEDPTVFCGTRKAKARIEEDLAAVDAAHASAKGDDKSATVTSTAALSTGLDALLNEDAAPSAPVETKPAPEPVTSFDDLPDTAPAAPKETKPAAASGSLDDILDNL